MVFVCNCLCVCVCVLIQCSRVTDHVRVSVCQTFCLYTRYREEVLSQAFQTCRNRALVNRRRPTSVYGLKKCHALPFLPMSYQLSQHYYK